MILFLHNRYRTTGGEERAVEDLMWLVREHLGEEAQLLGRDSALLGRSRAAVALLRGGLEPDDVAAAVRRTGARIVHAHNLLPGFGPRALRAARGAGAKVVLHLHNYRLVCAVGTCVNSRGDDCVRCHGRNTLPGVRLNCRGTGPEAAIYGAALALHQRAITEAANVLIVPSEAALARLRELRAPLDLARVRVVTHVVRAFADRSAAADGEHALVVSRLAREKDVGVAIEACRLAGVPLVVAGDGPLARELRAGAGPGVTFAGVAPGERLADLRARARVALAPSRAQETFGLAALESMAAGIPVVATRTGALAELAPEATLVAPGDAAAMAAAIREVAGDSARGERSIAAARARAGPQVAAPALAAAYAAAG